MASTFYDGTIGTAFSIITTFKHILQLAGNHLSGDLNLDFVNASLHSDMYPFCNQVRLPSYFSHSMAATLAGETPPIFNKEKPVSVTDCFARLDAVLEVLESTIRRIVNDRATTVIKARVGADQYTAVTSAAYAYNTVLPSICFHLVTAYRVLRKEGVPLGKADYYRGFLPLPKIGTK